METKKIKHTGDCFIYKAGSEICDCGALRKAIAMDCPECDDDIWETWADHLGAIDRSITEDSLR